MPLPHRSRIRRSRALGNAVTMEPLHGRVYFCSVPGFAVTSAVKSGFWGDPTVWSAGVPTAILNADIPAGFTVSLNVSNAVAKSVSVGGTLNVPEGLNKTLSTDYVMVHGGTFSVGSATNPYDSKFTLTLEGDDPTLDLPACGVTDNNAFLMTMDGGTLQLFGTPQKSWTKLDATANVGATTITLADPVAWPVGSRIVITSTTTDVNQTETRVVSAVSADGKTVTLGDDPLVTGTAVGLAFRHWGTTQTYTQGTRTWVLDQRAEVGLLDRNIEIKGDAEAATDGFGGHLMFMKGSDVQISNVELYQMGQKGRLGRYPAHWHIAEDATGDFMRDSSVVQSFNRAITVHGTEGVAVERNVAFDHVGHGIFLEDGSERFNKINYNLALMTRKPVAGEEILPTDIGPNEIQNQAPSTYWITNPNNEFIGNVAAGTATGTGFWFSFPASPLGLSASIPRFAGMQPYKQPLGEFRDNVSHTNMNGFDTNDGINADNSLRKNFGWDPPTVEYIDNFTVYANDVGLYSGIGNSDTIYRNAILADNDDNLFFASPQTAIGGIIIARSASGALPSNRSPRAFALYDGPGRMRDTHIVGFDASGTNLLNNIGGATKHPNVRFSGLTFSAAPLVTLPNFATALPAADPTAATTIADPRMWGVAIYDEDGTTTGAAGKTIIGNHWMMRTSTDTVPSAKWTRAFVSNYRFGLSRFTYSGLNAVTKPNVLINRTGGGEAKQTFFDGFKVDPHHQAPVILNNTFAYDYSFETLPTNRQVTVNLNDVASGDKAMIRLNALGKQTGLVVSGATLRTSLTTLAAGASTGYFVDSLGNVYIQFVTTGESGSVGLSWSANSTAAPTVTSKGFDFETGHAVLMVFSQDIGPSLTASDFQLINTTTGAIVSLPSTLSYDSATATATLKFDSPLPNGNWRVRLAAGGVKTASGVALTSNVDVDFFTLAGDVTRDRAVDFNDLLVLAQNYGLTGRTFSQGNINYSSNGEVDFEDLLQLAQGYNTSLSTAATPAVTPSTPQSTPRRRSPGSSVLS